jgi:hypothetical protein
MRQAQRSNPPGAFQQPSKKGIQSAMDQETLKLLAKVKVAARKSVGVDIDIQRLTHDAKYASEVLGKATQSDDESLVLCAITLQDKFGLLKEARSESADASAAVAEDKYKFGARG